MALQDLYLNAELSPSEQRAVQRRAKARELQRVAPGMFTPLPPEEWPALVARQRLRILAAFFPGAVVGFSSAMAGAMPVAG